MKLYVLIATVALAQQPGTIAIDKQEWRDTPVRHLYIHGTINGDTLFQLLLPERKSWKGRLLHYLEGSMGGSEMFGTALGEPPYALANGAAYVESSQGHRGPPIWRPEDTMEEIAYQASYAIVQYAKARCVELYGLEPRYSYVYGVSGGGIRSSGLLERFPKVYDGAVPVVGAGTLDYLWSLHSIYEDNRTKLDGRDAIVKAGFPQVYADRLTPLPVGMVMLDVLKYKVDSAYFNQFRSDQQLEGSVKMVNPKQMVIQAEISYPDQSLYGYTLTFTSGEAKGQWRRILGNQGALLVTSPIGEPLDGVQAGDSFTLDNGNLIAWRGYHRMRETRTPEQRAALLEPDRPLGKFRGKMIAVFGTHDIQMWPSVAVNYRSKVADPQSFRLHFVENANHGRPSRADREVFWDTTERKAMDDLMRWVEDGVEAPPGTVYSVANGQIVLPAAAAARKGYQPVAIVEGTAEGAEGAFSVVAQDPDNDVIRIEIDYESDGKFDDSRDARGRRVTATFRHTYDKPGEYIATVRVTDATVSRGSANVGIQNLARSRPLTIGSR